jgi:hypothetical protein
MDETQVAEFDRGYVRLINVVAEAADRRKPLCALTEAELTVLRQLPHGSTLAIIASELGKSRGDGEEASEGGICEAGGEKPDASNQSCKKSWYSRACSPSMLSLERSLAYYCLARRSNHKFRGWLK